MEGRPISLAGRPIVFAGSALPETALRLVLRSVGGTTDATRAFRASSLDSPFGPTRLLVARAAGLLVGGGRASSGTSGEELDVREDAAAAALFSVFVLEDMLLKVFRVASMQHGSPVW